MSKPVRERLKDDLESRYEKLLTVLDNALNAEASFMVREPCGKDGCRCRHIRYGKGPDIKTQLAAAEFLANQGLGRPPIAEAEVEKSIVFQNKIVLVANDQ